MPHEELTTTEFCQELERAEQVGPELSTEVTRFLKECDIRKFAPAATSRSTGPARAVPHAFNLIDHAEARLAQIREAEAAAPPVVAQEEKVKQNGPKDQRVP
jgi:hypothetical protein